MAVTKVVMPKVFGAMDSGKLLRWVKQEGDRVMPSDVIVEIETEKFDVELEAGASGIVRRLLVRPGDTVLAGSALAIIAETEEEIEDPTSHIVDMTSTGPHGDRPRSFEDMLEQVLSDSEENAKFCATTFFTKWFREHGRAYFFLFKKNLQVTNIQFAELLALIRTHCSHGDGRIRDLQFVSANEIGSAMAEIVDAFSRDPQNPRARYKMVAQLYAPLLRRIVVTDTLFGSCAVFIPPHLKVDLSAICGYAGYVHSCGYSVYCTNVNDAKKEPFFQAVETHLNRRTEGGKRVFFTVYAHEDFSAFDREQASELRHGLDEVKVFVEKFYMGPDRLVSVLEEMREKFGGRLEIADPGNYKDVHERFLERSDADRTRTLWLMVDRSIGAEQRSPGQERYFVCYDQMYVNRNPFHLFDENKPAWIAHTTIPHTLMGAMINITRPWWKEDREVKVLDPFVGTGTTWLEAKKFAEVVAEGSDWASMVRLLIGDNIAFFTASAVELGKFVDRLDLLEKLTALGTPKFVAGAKEDEAVLRSYQWAKEMLEGLGRSEGEFTFSPEVVRRLEEAGLFDRLLLYLALRATVRHSAAFERESKSWAVAYLTEAKVLRRQIGKLRELRAEADENPAQWEGSIGVFQSKYSLGCTIDSRILAGFREPQMLQSVIRIADATKLDPVSCDVIVTDPPYGFNTEEECERLATLYAHALAAMIDALKPDGQLVLCLIERSYIGRRTTWFAQKELVTQQILALAEEKNREIVSSGYSVPEPRSMFRPPYYWESERALRRAILHFRVHARGWRVKEE